MIEDVVFPILTAIVFLVFASLWIGLILSILYFIPKVFLVLLALWIIGSMLTE